MTPIIANLMHFYAGAFTYQDIQEMSIDEINAFLDEAHRINKQQNKK